MTTIERSIHWDGQSFGVVRSSVIENYSSQSTRIYYLGQKIYPITDDNHEWQLDAGRYFHFDIAGNLKFKRGPSTFEGEFQTLRDDDLKSEYTVTEVHLNADAPGHLVEALRHRTEESNPLNQRIKQALIRPVRNAAFELICELMKDPNTWVHVDRRIQIEMRAAGFETPTEKSSVHTTWQLHPRNKNRGIRRDEIRVKHPIVLYDNSDYDYDLSNLSLATALLENSNYTPVLPTVPGAGYTSEHSLPIASLTGVSVCDSDDNIRRISDLKTPESVQRIVLHVLVADDKGFENINVPATHFFGSKGTCPEIVEDRKSFLLATEDLESRDDEIALMDYIIGTMIRAGFSTGLVSKYETEMIGLLQGPAAATRRYLDSMAQEVMRRVPLPKIDLKPGTELEFGNMVIRFNPRDQQES